MNTVEIRKRAWIGIDPGLYGAAALITMQGGFCDLHDWFDVTMAAATLKRWRDSYDLQGAVVERCGARPGQGVVSMFNFGCNYGHWQGMLSALAIPFQLVAPATWQKEFFAKADGPGNSKAKSMTVARRHYPAAEIRLKKHNGRADALLLARFCRKHGG